MLLMTCLLWLLAAGMTWWMLTRQPAPEVASPAAPPRDPIKDEVSKWMHDWDRGRA